MYDAYKKENFTLRAMLFFTINDFPAYGHLSGYTCKGKMVCLVCIDDLEALRLEHSQKDVYWDFRKWLLLDHPFRRQRKAFNGKIEMSEAPTPLCSCEVYELVKDIEHVFGKPYKGNPVGGFKKKCKFWELPYWKNLDIRHCLDVMPPNHQYKQDMPFYTYMCTWTNFHMLENH